MFTSISSPTHVSHVSTSCDRKKLKQLRSRRVDRSHVLFGCSAIARETDPKKRIVITGMGLCSVFGNDYTSFYGKLLEGTSGVAPIDRFDTSDFPTKFAAQIRNFDNEGYIDKKNDRRLDDCLRYALVSGNKALEDAGLAGDL